MIDYKNIRLGKNAIVWTRVSTKYQEDNGGSLSSQKEVCERYAKEHGYTIVMQCGGKHESAKTPGPMIKKMEAFVKRDKSISTILISEFDRFSRELWQATKMLEDMRRLGIVVIATKFGMDTRTKEGMLMAQNTLAMAQWDNQNRTDKFVGGRADCIKAGAWVEKCPKGYRKEGKSRDTYCYLTDEGRLIAMAFRWKLQGYANTEILEKLKSRGLLISKQELHKIFVNPFYAGKIKHRATGGEVIDGQIEPAISYNDFLRVQEILSGRTGKYTQQKVKETCPLVKHVMCYADHTPFTSYTKTKQTKTNILTFDYYKCNKTGCKTNVSAKEMHEKYKALLDYHDLPESILSQFESIAMAVLASYGTEAQDQTTRLKRSLTEVEKNIKETKLRYASGKIDDDTFQTAIQEYGNRRDVIVLELEKWQTDLSNLMDKLPDTICFAARIGSTWGSANLDVKRRIQNLVFPEGVFWDKETRSYRTHRKNAVFAILDALKADFGTKKEEENSSSVPLCGRRDSNPYA